MPSEIVAAFLWAQLENLENIQNQRKKHWNKYYESLQNWALENDVQLPFVPNYATNNAHMFYLVCKSLEQRNQLIEKLKNNNILAVFHYISLHKSPFYVEKHDGRTLPKTDEFTDKLVRLPLFYELDVDFITNVILNKCDLVICPKDKIKN